MGSTTPLPSSGPVMADIDGDVGDREKAQVRDSEKPPPYWSFVHYNVTIWGRAVEDMFDDADFEVCLLSEIHVCDDHVDKLSLRMSQFGWASLVHSAIPSLS